MIDTSAVRRFRARIQLPHAVAAVARSGGMRMIVLPISAVLGIVNTRVIIDHFGLQAYAQFGLLVGIVSLLPFADLGVSAAVMNAVGSSDDPSTDPLVRRVLATSMRVLFGSMLCLITLAVVLYVSGAWPSVLGDGLIPGSGPAVATLCLVMIAVGMPVGFGQRVLAGIGKNHLNVALLGLQTPVVLLFLLGLVALHAGSGSYIAIVPYVVMFLLAALICFIAATDIQPMVGLSVRDALRVRSVRGGGVFAVAWPTLVQMIALPIAMQTDRLILSHVTPLRDLAEYNLASVMFTPVWGVVAAAGVALWPIFAKARAKGDTTSTSPTRLALGFGVAAAVICVLIALGSPWLAARASGGAVQLPMSLIVSFVVLMIFQAIKYPLGMYMTDPRGLRYQAYMIVLLLPLNLGLSWYLAIDLGPAGPVIGSAVGVFFCQVVANWIYVRRDLAARNAAAESARLDATQR